MTSVPQNLAKQTLREYWRHAKVYPWLIAGLIISVPLATLMLRFVPPLLIATILSKIEQGDFIVGDLWQSFGPQLALYAGASMLGGIVLWRIVVILIWHLEVKVVKDIHQRIFSHLLTLSPAFHADRFAGSLVSQANKFANAYVRIADTIVFQLSGLILSFIFTIIILSPRAPMVVIALLVFSLIFILIAIRITKPVRKLNAIEATKSNRQTGFLADAVSNVLAVKSFSASGAETERYSEATEQTKNAALDVMRASIKRDIFFSSSTLTLSVIALTLATASVVLGDADIATVYLVVNYTGVISQSLWEFTQSTLRQINRALGDAKDMVEILAIKPAITDPAVPEPSRISNGEIIFKQVTFAHSDTNNSTLFNNLNLTIKSGEKIGLVGHSGSGKTSLTKLLLRFNDIDSGEILIDGQNIANLSQNDLRKSISYVPQEPLLFHRSIRENIAYGKLAASDQEIIEAAKRANAHEFVETLPNRYETLVGERGIKLSGGQRQRIAIARALIKDAPILVLDEATSALDSESEKLIQAALWELMKGRTAIVIAHRLSTIQKMDRILVLTNGTIAEQGTHASLLKKQGAYATLWKHQSGGFLEE